MQLTNDLIPLKLPHFKLRGNNLFFLISSRPLATFDVQDIELWNTIDGSVQIGEITEEHPDAVKRLKKFWKLGICDFAPSEFPKNRKKVLIIEPHMDDAILSVGGLMWAKRFQCEFNVISVTGISNFTSYTKIDRDFFDVNTVTNLRLAESETVLHILGGKHSALDKFDAPLRYRPDKWSVNWLKRNRRSLSAYQNRSPSDQEIASWAASIDGVMERADADEIWIPMGIGSSTDHETTRNACLRVLMERRELIDKKDVYFYQDVPYGIEFPGHTAQIVNAFNAVGGNLERICDDISESLNRKLHLVSIFASQFKLSYMGPKVKASAHALSESDYKVGELRFKIKRLPDSIDELSMYSGLKYIEKILDQLTNWYPKYCNANRIRILCPMGVGKFAEYMEYLLKAFPKAVLEVHKTNDSIDETRNIISDRIQICPVDGQKNAWFRRLLSIFLSRPLPLIVFTHSKLEHLSSYIKFSYFLANPLVATTMDHLVLALRIKNVEKIKRKV